MALASRSWRALGVTVQVVVDDPGCLPAAVALLEQDVNALDRACSRFRPDSEVLAVQQAQGRAVAVSPLLAEAVAVALEAARSTDGDVDPTLGAVLSELGYDRDFAALPGDGPAPRVRLNRQANWRDVHVDAAGRLRVPAGVLLDLGATAKALGADRAARRIARELGCGVLVSLGGDLAVDGRVPPGGWPVRVQDRPGDLATEPEGPHETVALSGGGLATSSTTARRWQRGGQVMHHLLDPRSGLPVRSPWRTVSVTAGSCVLANTASTAAIIRGERAAGYLLGLGLPARLVSADGGVARLNGWPPPPEPASDR